MNGLGARDNMRITHCKLNHLTNPLGYSLPQLSFSWQVEEARGKRQEKASIRISEREELSDPVAECSGNLADGLNSLGTRIELNTKPRTRYYWNVSVQTDAGEEASGEVQWFETGKQDEPWSAKWITCDSTEPRHPIFCKELPCVDVKEARLYICGLGLYEAALNGEKIGDEYLTPYCNNYNSWLQYQTYDITDELQKGGDLQVMLGNGWYRGRFGFSGKEKPFYGTEWMLLAEVHITHEDGSEEVIGTDESWIVRRSKITFSNIYDGEKWDAALPELEEEQAVPAETPKGELTARYSVPVKPFTELKPVLLHTPAGENVLDLGQNMAGSFVMNVSVPAGETVHIQWGETLQDENFYRDNLRTAKAEFVYVSDGKPAVLAPKFTFYGGRYVKIEGASEEEMLSFQPLPLSSELEEIGTLTTGNDLVNRLIQNAWWSCRDNFIDVPTDCPQRDERMGWTGDAQVFSSTASFMLDTVPFYGKYLHDMATEQAARGGAVPDVVPAFEVGGGCTVWGDAGTIIPWTVYEHFGDTAVLENQFESMKSWVDYITKVDGENCHWREVFHYGDWLALDRAGAAADNVKGATDDGFIADVYYMYSAELVARTADILGAREDAAAYQALAERIRARIEEEYYTPAGRCAVPTQTGLLLTLHHHLADPVRTRAALLKALEENNNKLQTGFVGTPILCDVLSENGMEDMAERLLLNEEYPGWLHEVKLGATTIWERWNSLDENGHISSTGMNSLNHYSYGSIVGWMYRHLAGLLMDEPGYTKVRLEPKPVWKLHELGCRYRCAAGEWQVQWKCVDTDTLSLSVTVPFGCEAELVLPNWSEQASKGTGSEAAGDSADAVKTLHTEENPIYAEEENGVCHLQAGHYEVTYTTAEPWVKILSTKNSVAELLANPKTSRFLQEKMPGITQMPPKMRSMSLADTMKMLGGADDAAVAALDAALKSLEQ